MSSYTMSQIRNYRAAGVRWPREMELRAVIETVTECWSRDDVESVAQDGATDVERDAIHEVIETEGLSVTAEQAEAALVEWCREKVEV